MCRSFALVLIPAGGGLALAAMAGLLVGRGVMAIELGPFAPVLVAAGLRVHDPGNRLYQAGFAFIVVCCLLAVGLAVASHV